MDKFTKTAGAALAVAAFSVMLGCADKKGQDAALAAKVNEAGISVQTLNHELEKLGKAPEGGEVAGQVLQALIDQQLLMQKAVADKLDQDPEVAQALEASRRQILVQAYVRRLGEGLAKPADAEIGEYYRKHPELFSARRIYRLQELQIETPPDRLEAVKTRLSQGPDLNAFMQWLRTEKLHGSTTQLVKTAEEIPMPLLTRLHPLKEGQHLILAEGKRLDVVFLIATQTQPVSEAQARPAIERLLLAQKRREKGEAELKALREKAKIEYFAPYRETAKAGSPAAGKP